MLATLTALLLIQGANTLTPDETKAGWKLLFDGQTTKGWRNFKSDKINPGWKVVDGTLKSVDPHTAGDIVTTDKYDWFELKLDYNLEKGQNSGVMFHVADDGEATWQSAPEVQLYDDEGNEGAEKSGWLYQLYKSPVDAAKPAGQWNTLRMLISPEKCTTEINGVKYYDFVLWSDDWNTRVAKSKFSSYPGFGKLKSGAVGIQGDHGVVSFRNIKIRPIK
jgi:hypothetical protein